jgi:hypothetical protein
VALPGGAAQNFSVVGDPDACRPCESRWLGSCRLVKRQFLTIAAVTRRNILPSLRRDAQLNTIGDTASWEYIRMAVFAPNRSFATNGLYQISILNTHLTALCGRLVRSNGRHGVGHHKAFATTSSGPQSAAFGGAERPAGRRYVACEMPHIERRAVPSRRAAPPHEMCVQYRDLVLVGP